jgi:hypothetical protein
MPRVRYQIPPMPSQRGVTAFTPVPVRYGSSHYAYKIGVVGAPGTRGIPAPTWNSSDIDQYRGTTRKSGMTDALSGGAPGSGYAPDVIWPSLYYLVQHLSYGIGGVAVFSDNLLPHPALDPRLSGKPIRRSVQGFGRPGSVGPVAFPGRNDFTQPAGRQSGSQKQIGWPQRNVKWPWTRARADG